MYIYNTLHNYLFFEAPKSVMKVFGQTVIVRGWVCQLARLSIHLSRLSVPLPLSSTPASQSLWGDTESKAEYTWLYYLELTNWLSLSLTTLCILWFPVHASPGCVSCSHSLVLVLG